MNTRQILSQRIDGSLQAIASLRDSLEDLTRIAQDLEHILRNGGTIYTAGNGGSAAQALHFAEELIGRYRQNRVALRAVCLNADPTALTCIANDYGFDQLFARQCEALLTKADALVVFTTSGRSQNIINALHAARAAGCATFGLLGGDGGPCRVLCDRSIVICAPGAGSTKPDSAFVQDAHGVALHLFCEALEQAFAASAR